MRSLAARLHLAEPYKECLHPVYGDARPQRLPAKNFHEEDEEGYTVTELATRFLRRHRGKEIPAAERYFLYYPEGTQMHDHTDPDPREHWRACVVVDQKCAGGVVRMDGLSYPLIEGDLYVFKADEIPHGITPITAGHRLVWTVAFYG